MNEYLQKVKMIASSLAMASDLVSSNDQLLYVLNGVGLEYESLITAITTRIDAASLTVDDIQGLILNHDILLQKHTQQVTELSANLAQSNLNSPQYQQGGNKKNYNRNRGNRYRTIQKHFMAISISLDRIRIINLMTVLRLGMKETVARIVENQV